MTMTELKQYMADNKRIKVAQWNKERQGNHCQGFTRYRLNQGPSVQVDRDYLELRR